MDDNKWSCSCGFVTHNEYVWIEHIHICRESYGHLKEEPVDVSRTVSQPVDDINTTTQDVYSDITAEATAGKVDKQKKTTIFRADNKAEDAWQDRKKEVVLAIAAALTIPVIIMIVLNISSLLTAHKSVSVAPGIQYGDFANVMFTNSLFEPIKGGIPRKPNQISPFGFRFAAKSDWIIMPVQPNKTAKKVVEPVKDNDVLTGEDQKSDEDQDLDEDQDSDDDQDTDEERDPSPGNDTQEKTLENK